MVPIDPFTDRHHLTSQTYASNAALDVRTRTHRLYTRPPVDFPAWVLGQIPWRGDELVLDVGCGSGFLVSPLLAHLDRGGRLVSVDLSLGMLRQVATQAPAAPTALLNADAMALPLRGSRFDVVIASHVFHHLPDIGRGISEAHRVLQPAGHLIAVTGTQGSMQRFRDELGTAAAALGCELEVASASPMRFNLENGRQWLERSFADVDVRVLEDELVFPAAAPACAYIDSMRATFEPGLPPGLGWEMLLAQVGRQIEAAVRRTGDYRVPKRTGVLIACRE